MECELVLGRDDPDQKFPVSFSRDQTIPEITTTMASGVVEGVLWIVYCWMRYRNYDFLRSSKRTRILISAFKLQTLDVKNREVSCSGNFVQDKKTTETYFQSKS